MTVDEFKVIPREKAVEFIRDCAEAEFDKFCDSVILRRYSPGADCLKNENIKELLRLMCEYPDLPVIPWVSADVVADDSHYYWTGNFSKPRVEQYWESPSGTVYTRDSCDVDAVLCEALGEEAYEAISTEQEENKAFESLPWKTAIVICIEV